MNKRVLLAFAVIALGAQLIRPRRNVASRPPGRNDFIVRYAPPAPVANVLRTACYDCHSDDTRYPWYANVQPVGWWLADHVHDGKRSLNFSAFGAYTIKMQARKLDEISDALTERKMPPGSYAWVHRGARLTKSHADEISEWVDNLHDRLLPDP